MNAFLRVIIFLAVFLIHGNSYSQLSGSYTIGSGGNYPTITGAISSLLSQGVNGSVTFNILPGVYAENVTIESIPGSSLINTVTFQSSTLDTNDVKWVSVINVHDYMLKIDGADNLVFRKIAFVGNYNSIFTRTVIQIVSQSQNLTFVDNAIRHINDYNPQIDNYTILEATGGGISGLNIDGNKFTGFGRNLPGTQYGIQVSGVENFSLKNNEFLKCVHSLWLAGVSSPLIEKNIFDVDGTQTNYLSYYGIKIISCINQIIISKNKFYVRATMGSGARALDISNSQCNNAMIVNNFFVIGVFSYGMWISNSSGIECYFNSTYTGIPLSDNLFITSSTNIESKNNLLLNFGKDFRNGLPFTSSNSQVTSDFNNFFRNTPHIARINSVYLTDLAQLIQATGNDSNSNDDSVKFVSSQDLHLAGTSIGDQNLIGTPISSVTDDIDGNPRNPMYPVMGADEPQFTFSAKINLGMLIQGFYDITADEMVADTIEVFLRKSNSPYDIQDFAKIYRDSSNEQLEFFNAPPGSYYIVLDHRNSIETWSKFPQNLNLIQPLQYDFTQSATRAFGDNMILKGAEYCIYNGDVNQDETVDVTDVVGIYNDAIQFTMGYVPTDLTGDDFVDADDLIIAYNNSLNFVSAVTP